MSKKENQELIERIVNSAKHWAKSDRKLLPASLKSTFDFIEGEYFKEFEMALQAHANLLNGVGPGRLLQCETIIRNYMKRGYQKNPARYICRNLAIACLITIGDLNRNAIKAVFKAEKTKGSNPETHKKEETHA